MNDQLTHTQATRSQSGVALLAVLLALSLLLLLALPFGISMSAGADAAMREVEAARAAQGSASVRDLLLSNASMSHQLFDETPTYDSLLEWPDGVTLPEKMQALLDEGKMTLGGEVEDLQRKIALDSISPLVLANLLGSTARLSEPLEAEAAVMVVDNADGLPEEGFVWLAHEMIRYNQKDGNRLLDLERGLFLEQGFAKPTQTYEEQNLVLDYRCVLAAAWPFLDRSGSVRQRRPYAAVTELAGIAKAGLGSFRQDEMDVLTSAIEVAGMAETSATWGRPERVFNDLLPGQSKTLRVKSALHIGGGSTVRLRDEATGAVEYGLVMSASSERSPRDLLLPSVFNLGLLLPVTQAFGAGTTVVEPLVPAPINVNTAPREVLLAMLQNVRRAADVFVHDADGRQRATPPRPVSASEAAAMADQILSMRADDSGAPGQGPLQSWQDFVDRVMRPRLEGDANRAERSRLMYIYRNLRTGRDSAVEMGTVPMCFTSGPWVRIRAAASLKRSRIAVGIAARHERVTLAAAVPGYRLEHAWRTQQQFENALVLDRRAPYWATTPINLGAIPRGDIGNDPSSRYVAHLLPLAFGEMGFGAARYPTLEPTDAGITPNPAMARHGTWPFRSVHGTDSFEFAQSPRGHDLSREGAFLMTNNGPSGPGSTPPPASGRHDGINFPFTQGAGFMAPFAVQWWLEPESLEGTTVFDYGDGDPDRNRFALHGRDGNLALELIDEAGIDPEPSQSPAGVERTATEIRLPLAELGLPANTPVHLNIAAMTGRPTGVAMHVDGMPRGKARYVTYLTAAIPAFDPTLANNLGMPPQRGNDRYLTIQVEDVEGFPQVGTLRIGTELFEYTSIDGNAFVCEWNDSIGGRGARQVAREHRPDITVDSQGRPTVDINELRNQGINIDVFPEHPAGAKVELYGYSTPLSPDSPMMVGETRLAGAIGGFAVARGFLSNGARPLAISMPQGGGSFPVGEGIDENWTGDLELADPVQTSDSMPTEAQDSISSAFSATGGYALLIQMQFGFEVQMGNLSNTGITGGMEVIRYSSRQGGKLLGIQRAQMLPGDDRSTPTADYDGQARRFVTKWREDLLWAPPAQEPMFHDVTRAIVWVVPISLAVQNTQTLWDPQTTGLTEWVQLYPDGGDVNDTEWVRYDAVADSTHLVRANRRAWERTRYELTRYRGVFRVRIGQNGQSTGVGDTGEDPWGQVQATSGYIGYTPQLESEFPQINRARRRLGFRGDMMLDFYQEGLNRTSSHAHSNARVTQCQRLDLSQWGNYSAFSGRPGRHDRIAIIDGDAGAGGNKTVEWHTVNWVARRFGRDNRQNGNVPSELLGPWDFQLIAFTDAVQGYFQGPPTGQQNLDVRAVDRIVKFPSGELPSVYANKVPIGSGIGNTMPVTGYVDEVDVVQHGLRGLVVEEVFQASAQTFRVHQNLSFEAHGPVWWQNNLAASYPRTGGLLQIGDEIIAYKDQQDGEFTVATNGRGMFGTEIRDHDRGDHVLFLTNRPCAILSSGVGARDDVLPVQSLGALSPRSGTVALGQELLHYTWVRIAGDDANLEMPRWYPPGEQGSRSLARGLFRGRFGTSPQAGSSGEAVVQWPFRYWDRYAERSDDPELAYFQLTTTAAPSYFRSLQWKQEVPGDGVDVICRVRTDSRAAWDADAATTPGLWEFRQQGDAAEPLPLSAQGSRLEVRFATRYRSGAVDLVTMRAHGWKTSAKVREVVVEYEGEPRIFDERITLR